MALVYTIGRRTCLFPIVGSLLITYVQLTCAQYIIRENSEVVVPPVPCRGYKPGEDDLETFDFIRHYKLDLLESQYPGVTRVRGSNRLQTAYRVDKEAELTLPTRELFPSGLPQEFSFICTLKTRKVPKNSWSILRIIDSARNPEFAITLNPRKQTLDLTIADYKGNMQTLSFSANRIFDKQWHKIHFGVFKEKVVLHVDCELVGTMRLKPCEPIDIGGEIAISKIVGSHTTVPIDLQWMVLNCDPTMSQRETCDELPITGSSPLQPQRSPGCNDKCPQGPPGLNGTVGPRGQTGMPGLQGEPGKSITDAEIRDICTSILREQMTEMAALMQGRAGPPGRGRPGRQGPQGRPGEPGPPGSPGERGFVGLPGPEGPAATMGPPGERGDKGDRGPEGTSIEGPVGLPGNPGNDGVGLPGNQGERGERGRQGIPGTRGAPGAQGPPGFCEFCNYPSNNYLQYNRGNDKG